MTTSFGPLRALGVLAAMGLFGCTASRDAAAIASIYRADSPQAGARASSIIFVPGIQGSVLVDPADGVRYWGRWWGDSPDAAGDPAALRKLARPMALGVPLSKLDDELVAGKTLLDVELRVPGQELHLRGYSGLFEGLFAYLKDPDAKLAAGDALPMERIRRGEFPIVEHGYDWRRDISREAARLHRTVLAAVEASKDPDHRVDLVGHSMGCLLVRWYLRYGDQPIADDGTPPPLTWAGAQHVRRALIVAPPNAGSVAVLDVLLDGDQPSWALPRYPAALVGTFTSVYELLPRTEDQHVVDAATGQPVDLFDVATWEKLSWGLFAPQQAEVLAKLLPHVPDAAQRRAVARDHLVKVLRRARAFQAALDRPARPPPWLRLHLFAGDGRPTPAVVQVDLKTGARIVTRWAPGDGQVTRRSALRDRRPPTAPGRLDSSVDWHSVHFLNEDHMGITASPAFFDDALYLLLDAPDPERAEGAVQASASP